MVAKKGWSTVSGQTQQKTKETKKKQDQIENGSIEDVIIGGSIASVLDFDDHSDDDDSHSSSDSD